MEDDKTGTQGTSEGQPEGGTQGNQEAQPQTVSVEDFKNLQSVLDTKVRELSEDNVGLRTEVTDLKAELTLVKEGLPTDQAGRVEADKELRLRTTKLDLQEEGVTKGRLNVKARELLLKHPKVEMTVEDLEKLGNETDMELTILRKAAETTTTSASPPGLPQSKDLDKGGKTSGGLAGDLEQNLKDVEQAKTKGR